MTNEEITLRVRDGAGQSLFRPCAVFDQRLDCIRVIARDTSVTEIRVDGRFTVLEDNHPKGRKYVGFTIKGARHLCHEIGVDLTAPVQLAQLLDALLEKAPNPLVGILVDTVARPLVTQERIEQCDLSHQSVVPALV